MRVFVDTSVILAFLAGQNERTLEIIHIRVATVPNVLEGWVMPYCV